jgi:hypothetical protein
MVELIREYERTDACRFGNLIDNFDESWSIVEANAAELKAELARLANPASAELWDVDLGGDRPALRAALVEVVRRLHSFLAAGIAMVDYTKTKVELYRGRNPGCATEHRSRYRALCHADGYGFLKFLRDWSLHIDRHAIGARAPFAAKRTPAIYLFSGPLREACRSGRGWAEQGAARFLMTAGDEIDVSAIPRQYLASVRDFLNWFRGEQVAAYRSAADEAKPLLDEMVRRRDSAGPKGANVRGKSEAPPKATGPRLSD